MIKKFLSFNGRIMRKEYALTYLIYFILSMIIQKIVAPYGWNSNIAWIGLAYVPMCYILLTQTAKRCHDVGKSGWNQMIPLYFLLWFFEKGEKGANEYGESPEVIKAIISHPDEKEDK